MKTILVPSDFSKSARNAINYAVEMAKVMKAKIILFHVYNIPIVSTDVPVEVISVDEIEKAAMFRLKRIAKNIHLKHKKLNIECDVQTGFPVDEINVYAKKNKIDLIVMGMEGAGYLKEKIIGSTTTSLIKKAKCPVLAIDKHVKFKSIKKIALTADYNEIKNKAVLDPLKELARLFKSKVFVINVVKKLETNPPISKLVAAIKLDHLLESVHPSSFYIKRDDVIKGINDFVAEKKMDMVVMIPRKHTVLQNLFQESNTKHLIFHTKVPVLALQE